MVFMELNKPTFQFLLEAALHIINFILWWSMNIQNNGMTPVTYYYYYSRLSILEPLLFLPSTSSVVLMRLSGPHARPIASQKI
jgi:hypothetical protein